MELSLPIIMSTLPKKEKKKIDLSQYRDKDEQSRENIIKTLFHERECVTITTYIQSKQSN